MKTRNGSVALAILAAGALAGCGGATNQTPATLALTECRVANVENAVKCARLPVFENRTTNQGRKIDLNIVVLPATARIKEPDPIFLFAGGPGQAASDLAREALAMLGGLNAKRDIVLLDQRGTGKSNGLSCKGADNEMLQIVDAAKREQLSRKLLADCREALSKRADLTQYTTTIAMADADEVRAALGYDRINLWGGSYGTRAAMEYLRRYPDRVRSVVIDGVASPSLALPATFARDAGASYEKMLAACEQDKVCAAQYAGLKSQINDLLVSLDRQPRKIALTDPLTGKSREVAITRDGILMAVFSTLYVPELTAVVPESLVRARQGDFGPLMAVSSAFSDGMEDKMAMGMRFSVVCAEDVPRYVGRNTGSDAIAPFGVLFEREFAKACEGWPKGDMAKDFDQPVTSAKPVLILSGGLDPVTPPLFGEEVKKTLSNSLHLIAPNVGHGVSARGCSPKLIKKFIETASVAGIDGKCLERLPRPTFFEPMKLKDPAAAAVPANNKQSDEAAK
ncbi:MAG: alpha/beta fold hydrolase [Betaproteobacteria bacterium]|nr:alpha/beta fold hydrolase [Betaproteobacteria bacterium]